MSDKSAEYQEGYEDGYGDAKYDSSCEYDYGYDQGREDALAETTDLHALLLTAGFVETEDFVGRWDAAERKWILRQGDRTVWLG